MEPSAETITARVIKLNSQILGKTQVKNSKLNVVSREGLLDTLQLLYDECNTDSLKQYDKNIKTFVEKYGVTIQELKKLRVNISDFEIKDVIGRGHFGEVHVVREKQTGDVYAMKTIRKCDAMDTKRTSFEEERNIMALSQSVWLTSLQYAFQDNTSLFYIMEYHPGGDLLGLLYRQGGSLPESAASFYIAELVLALQDLHQMGYVHRDVKPDNILLDRCGHLKLADFGSAARLNKEGVVMDGIPVGTPDYIAPEVLQSTDNKSQKKTGYGVACDYWSVGILAYKLTIGSTPFTGQSTTSIYSKIMNYLNNLKFPPDVVLSQAYVSLIKGLVTDQKNRLTHQQILKHPLFKNVDFGSLRDQVPPYVPKITAVDDTSNFSDVQSKKKEPDMMHFKRKTQFSGRNLPFIGFTFTPDGNEEYSVSYKRSVKIKDEMMQNLKQEIHTLKRKLLKTENLNEEKEILERKLEEKSRKLESVEHMREKLERDLAKNIGECMILKRTLELERKDRAEVEQKALDLIKSAKQKWEAAEKSKVEELTLELEQQKEKITQLSTTNDMLNEQLRHALQLQNKHKVTTESIQNLNRRSVVGLESRLEKITLESQMELSDLRLKLSEESNSKNALEAQLKLSQSNETSLVTKLQTNEESYVKLQKKLEGAQKSVRDMEKKVKELEGCTAKIGEYKKEIEGLKAKLEREKSDEKIAELEKHLVKEKNEIERLKKQNEDLQSELVETTRLLTERYERHLSDQKASLEKQIASLEEELQNITKNRDNLEDRLQEADQKEQSVRAKVRVLEDLVTRFESGLTKLEDGTEREALLKEQVQRLEQQLVEVHELSAVQKQELSQLKTKFWRLEKDFENAEIDKRILQRELKEAEKRNNELSEQIQRLQGEMEENKKLQENALLELSTLNENLADEVFKLKDVVRSMEEKMTYEKEKCDEEKSYVEELKREIREKERRIEELKFEMERLDKEKLEFQGRIAAVRGESEVLRNKLDVALKEKERIGGECENLRRELSNTQLNLHALREACTLLEHQLTEYERIHESLEQKHSALNSNTEKLISDLAKAKEEVQEAKRQTNEEKSLRLLAETKAKRLREDIECFEKECNAYKEQCMEFKQYSSGLAEELSSAEERVADLEVTLKSYERQMDEYASENRILKEENSAQLTHLCNIKETNLKLNHLVNEYKETHEQLVQKIYELESLLNEKTRFYKERELKAEATIQQQTKLIDYLQSKNEELTNKKKTFAERIFSHSKKENQPPSIPLNYKDLENQLTKQRHENKTLRDEILQLKSTLSCRSNGGSKKTSSKCDSPRTKVAAEQLVRSPTSQRDLARQNSVQRMHHNIPHRFETRLSSKSTKCDRCALQISMGRSLSVCKECGMTMHNGCAKNSPRTCGLPRGLVKHYTDTVQNKNILETKEIEVNNGAVEEDTELLVEGWLKIPEKTNKSWQKRYAKLTPSELQIYDDNSSVKPVEIINLKPSDGHGKIVLEPLLSEIDVPVANTDVPYLVKIEISPNTTCWPPKSYLLMMLGSQEKERWYKALRTILQINDAKHGEIILQLTQDLYINCFINVLPDTYLLGTDQGLYSYHNKTLTKISGPSSVVQISIIKPINRALMIINEQGMLVSCDLGHLNNLAQCAECTRPSLEFEELVVPRQGFHILQTADFVNQRKVVAATDKQLIILNYEMENNDFVPVRLLDTAEPTSCILFTKHSVIVGVNKFFEIDLATFQAEEFLDVSDAGLRQALKCYKLGSFPVAIFKICDDPIEYLVCFNEFALFVDEYGRNSRVTDIKWHHVPRAFHFSSPYLYVVEFAAIEVIKIKPDTCNLRKDSVESLLNVDSFRVEFSSPRFVGGDKKGVFLALPKEIRYFDARRADEDNLSISSQSTYTVDGNEADAESDRFSFTSSIIQGLDNSETENGERGRHVTFDTDV